MNKVLIFDTAIGTSNQGDEIIMKSAIEGLMPVIHNASLYRMGTHIHNYTATQMLLHKVRPSGKMQQIVETVDCKFICGTNLIVEDLFRLRPQMMLNHFNAPLYDDTVLLGVGRRADFLKFRNKYTAELYRKVLSKNYIHSVRDDETRQLLQTIGIQSVNTGCPTLWMMTKEKCANIPRKKADHVVFSLNGYKSGRDMEKDLSFIQCLLRNYREAYVWLQASPDEAYLRRLVNPEDRNIKKIYSIRRLGEILSEGNVDYIGMRLHGGIFALQHDIRSLVISVDERADGFHKSMNLPVLKRDNLSQLEEILNSDIVTDIHLREKEMATFLGQFS